MAMQLVEQLKAKSAEAASAPAKEKKKAAKAQCQGFSWHRLLVEHSATMVRHELLFAD